MDGTGLGVVCGPILQRPNPIGVGSFNSTSSSSSSTLTNFLPLHARRTSINSCRAANFEASYNCGSWNGWRIVLLLATQQYNPNAVSYFSCPAIGILLVWKNGHLLWMSQLEPTLSIFLLGLALLFPPSDSSVSVYCWISCNRITHPMLVSFRRPFMRNFKIFSEALDFSVGTPFSVLVPAMSPGLLKCSYAKLLCFVVNGYVIHSRIMVNFLHDHKVVWESWAFLNQKIKTPWWYSPRICFPFDGVIIRWRQWKRTTGKSI